MAILAFVHTGLKAFAAFWALLTFAVAAALMARLNDDFGSDEVNDTNFAAGNAIIAAGVLALLYFMTAIALILRKPESILISLALDTAILSFLFIFFLASSAALSTEGDWFRFFSHYKAGSLGQATLALSWLMTFLILAILLLEVIYTLVHYGGSWTTWRTPFNHLLAYGSKGSGSSLETGVAGSGVPMTTVPATSIDTAGGATAPAHPGQQATTALPATHAAHATQHSTQTVTPFPHSDPAPAQATEKTTVV